jgi:hypothetical protein
MADWRRLLDDLEPNDKLSIDLGDTMVAGKYVKLLRAASGVWMLELKNANGQELVVTKEIQAISKVG